MLVVVLLVFYRPPWIRAVNPTTAKPGEVIVISGLAFGEAVADSWLSIDGRRVGAAYILSWDDGSISFRLPDTTSSGLVEVHTPTGLAEGPYLTNQDQVPATGLGTNGAPMLSSIQPVAARPGQEITLHGQGFGASIVDRTVLVDGLRLDPADIALWSDTQIRLVLPGFARQGLIRVITPGGQSPTRSFAVQSDGIALNLGTLRERLLSVGYRITDVVRKPDFKWGKIHVYLPVPPANGEQSFDYQEFKGPFSRTLMAHLRLDMYSLDSPQPGTSYELQALWRVQRRAWQVRIDPAAFVPGEIPAIYQTYLRASATVPSADPALAALVRTVIQPGDHPWVKARKLYDAVIGSLRYDPEAGLGFAAQVLGDKKAAAFGFANLLVGLLRNAAVPARMVEGLLILANGKPQTHYWVEFFIGGLGWVSADPAMGRGFGQDEFADPQARADAYFAGLDDRHITLIEGEPVKGIASVDRDSQRLFQRFVLLDTHSESQGDIDRYKLTLLDPQIQVVGQ